MDRERRNFEPGRAEDPVAVGERRRELRGQRRAGHPLEVDGPRVLEAPAEVERVGEIPAMLFRDRAARSGSLLAALEQRATPAVQRRKKSAQTNFVSLARTGARVRPGVDVVSRVWTDGAPSNATKTQPKRFPLGAGIRDGVRRQERPACDDLDQSADAHPEPRAAMAAPRGQHEVPAGRSPALAPRLRGIYPRSPSPRNIISPFAAAAVRRRGVAVSAEYIPVRRRGVAVSAEYLPVRRRGVAAITSKDETARPRHTPRARRGAPTS